ncbi:MAG: hypothetical protein V3V71_04115 [Roseateles sp.]
MSHLDDERRRVLCVAGVLEEWPSAFSQYLENLVAVAPPEANLAQMFSPAYTVVRKQLCGRPFRFISVVLNEVVGRHYRGELCRRHKSLMPELVAGHRFQALAKVSRQTGISRVGLKRMVECAAVPGYRFRAKPGAGREVITIDPAEVKVLAALRAGHKCLKGAAAFLGLKRSRLRQLVELGLLTAESHPEWDRTSHWFFADKELKRFVECLLGWSTERPPALGIALTAILRFWRLAPLDLKALMDALRAGSVSFHLPEGARMSEMLVDRQQACAWLQAHRAEAVSWLTPTQAAQVLCLKEQVVYELIERDLLRAKRTRGSRGWVSRIDRDEVQAFRETYVSLATLAKSAGRAPRALLTALPVAPVTGPTLDGARQYFFRRADLPEIAGLT